MRQHFIQLLAREFLEALTCSTSRKYVFNMFAALLFDLTVSLELINNFFASISSMVDTLNLLAAIFVCLDVGRRFEGKVR